ncbi:hypothetical protein ABT382_27065 [Streptomyces pharetrae]|uniref:hypothetical protein n=1 Tax=Streptomyces pharetrae TaxID=291370 RepID=UPI00335D418D
MGRLAWGDGELPLSDYRGALGLHGYHGWMTFELFGDGRYPLDPRAAVERCPRRYSGTSVRPRGERPREPTRAPVAGVARRLG